MTSLNTHVLIVPRNQLGSSCCPWWHIPHPILSKSDVFAPSGYCSQVPQTDDLHCKQQKFLSSSLGGWVSKNKEPEDWGPFSYLKMATSS